MEVEKESNNQSSGEVDNAFPIPGQFMYRGVLPIGSMVFPADVLDRVLTFQPRADDVIIFGYPKSGTTWLQEIVWQLKHNSMTQELSKTDAKNLAEASIWDRVPLIEMKMPGRLPYIDNIEEMPSPRLYKSHLPVWFFQDHLLESGSKCIVIMRNPKDMLVSYYHFAKLRHPKIILNWNQWFDMFKNNQIQYGNWFDHVLAWWRFRHQKNFLFVTYEEMKSDTFEMIKKIANFLKFQSTDEIISSVVERSSFQKMKNDPSSNLSSCSILTQSKGSAFIRSGVVGDWMNYFTVEQNDYFDRIIKERLSSTGLKFVYE